MSRVQLLTTLFGVCLLAQPLIHNGLAAAQDDGGEAFDEKDVVVLTADSFDSMIKKHKYSLVEFYAPWCGHCKTLAPEYAEAATELKAYDSTIMLGKVDATVHGELAEAHGVQGYPTLKWFVDGVASDYEGPREADGIVKWVMKKTGPATIKLSAAELTKAAGDDEATVVGYFKKFDSAEHKAFVAAASASDLTFVETDAADVAKVAGLTKPGVAVMQNFAGESPAQAVYMGSATDSAAIGAFVTAESLPLMLPFTPENTDKIFSSGIPRHLIILAKPADLESGSKTMNEFKAVATKLKGSFIFVTVDADSENAEPVISFFGLDVEKAPQVVGFVMEPKQQKFLHTGTVTATDLEKFGSSILDGSLQPEVKSADIPEDDIEDGVKVVVGKSFETICKDSAKDVLLEVYAPWCGHCKSLAPIYTQLAKRFAGIESVVVAKLDGTENEHAEIDIAGFPSLVLYPAKGGEAIPYDGARTLSALTDFLRENAAVKFELTISAEQEAADEAEAEAAAAAAAAEGDEEDYGEEAYDDSEMDMEQEEEGDPAHDEM